MIIYRALAQITRHEQQYEAVSTELVQAKDTIALLAEKVRKGFAIFFLAGLFMLYRSIAQLNNIARHLRFASAIYLSRSLGVVERNLGKSKRSFLAARTRCRRMQIIMQSPFPFQHDHLLFSKQRRELNDWGEKAADLIKMKDESEGRVVAANAQHQTAVAEHAKQVTTDRSSLLCPFRRFLQSR